MSIIFWTITLIVVVKYMLIVLMADDDGGEGKLHSNLQLGKCIKNYDSIGV